MYYNYICTKINFKTMRQHHKTCRECNAPFTSKRSDAKYCSGACKQHYCLKNRGYLKPDIDLVLKENDLLKRCLKVYMGIESFVGDTLPKGYKEHCKQLNLEIFKAIGKF